MLLFSFRLPLTDHKSVQQKGLLETYPPADTALGERGQEG